MQLLAIDILAILKTNVDRTMFHYNLQNFRMCTIAIEALTPLYRTSRIKLYTNIARSRFFCRMAKRFIVFHKVIFVLPLDKLLFAIRRWGFFTMKLIQIFHGKIKFHCEGRKYALLLLYEI